MDYKFTSSMPYLLNRVGVRMGELFNRHLAGYGLTLPMYRVMAVLRQEGQQRLVDLGAKVTVELSTLSRLVGTMKKAGLLTRKRHEADARTVRIELTDKGRLLVDELMPVAAHYETVATRTFSAGETAWLKDALRQIYGNLDALEDGKGAEDKKASA